MYVYCRRKELHVLQSVPWKKYKSLKAQDLEPDLEIPYFNNRDGDCFAVVKVGRYD